LPGYYPLIYALNNYDEFCYEGILYDGSLSTSPHLFSNLHGVVINDPYQYQWGGGINDAGTLVWSAPANQSSPVWEVFEATWLPSPVLAIVPVSNGLALKWPTNAAAFHVQYTTNLTPVLVWDHLPLAPATNSGNFYQVITNNLVGNVFFRLSTGAP
jgi:hypothetical protein